MIAGGCNTFVKIYNLNNGALVHTITSPQNVPSMSVAGDFIFTGGIDQVNMWLISSGSLVYTFNGLIVTTFQVFARGTGSGMELFVADYTTIRMFNVTTRQVIRNFGDGAFCTMTVQADMLFGGTCYYSAPLIYQWNITDGRLIRTFTQPGTMLSFDSSLYVANDEGTLLEYLIPELAKRRVTTITRRTSTRVPTKTTTFETELSNLDPPLQAGSSVLNSILIGLGVTIGFISIAVMGSIVYRYKLRHMEKSIATSKSFKSTSNTRASSGRLNNVSHFPTITSSTSFSSSNTQTATSVTQTSEIAIPAFLELRWGLDFLQEGLIARGGGGSIYQAKCFEIGLAERSRGQKLVVKNMDQQSLEVMNDGMRLAFFQEVSLMWRFRHHPNFIQMYAYSIRPVTIVMKYYQLGDLWHLVSGRGSATRPAGIIYSKSTLISLFRQLCDAINHMHQCAIVHCDIRPENVLLDKTAQTGHLLAIVSDFGISRIINKEVMKVQAFEISDLRGVSISYAAPEALLRFRAKTVETRGAYVWKAVDVYALSISLMEMLIRRSSWRKK